MIYICVTRVFTQETETFPARSCVGTDQSYVSSGRGLTLTQTVRESTAVAGLDWIIHYEVSQTPRCTFIL